MKTTIGSAILVSATIIVSNVGAQTYPSKPVRIFSPWAAGGVQVAFFAVGPSAAMRKTGKIKTLAVMLGKRVPQMPDVPSYTESPGLDFPLVVTWFGLCAQAATPQAIVQRLNAEVSKRLVANEALRDKFMTSQGLAVESPGGESPEVFGKFLLAEQERYTRLAKLAGIKPQ